jgi:hypothetical protein
MRAFWPALAVICVGLATWWKYGERLGNEARYRSDQLMLELLRATSEFENESA